MRSRGRPARNKYRADRTKSVRGTLAGANQSPLRSRARTLMPFLSPRFRTTCSSVGTVRLFRGDTLIIDRTLGISSSLVVVPTIASPFNTSGDALSIRSWYTSFPLSFVADPLMIWARTNRLRIPSDTESASSPRATFPSCAAPAP